MMMTISPDNNEVIFPVGFRFQPSDEELVLHYLKMKVFSIPSLGQPIPECQIFQLSPWEIPGDSEEMRFFFTKRKTGSSSGIWKASEDPSELEILAPDSDRVVGLRKSYVYSRENESDGKSEWVMHEFSLASSEQVENWVVCRVYKSKEKAADDSEEMDTSSSAETMTSDTSGITQASCGDNFDLEELRTTTTDPQN